MTPLLEIRDLVKHFPVGQGWLNRNKEKVYALNGVSLTLMPGETIGVVGESGCGKSTLGRTLVRLHEITAGQILLKGQDFSRLSGDELRQARRHIQMIFQDPSSSLNPRMKIRDVLAEPFEVHPDFLDGQHIEHAINSLLDLVNLPHAFKDRFPHELSGGQKQRIGIARAIALRPQLVIADEPVSALDVSVQSQILNLLMDLKAAFGLSMIFISHDLAVIEHVSDKVAVMYLGRIVEWAEARDLYQSPLHPYTLSLLEAVPRIEGSGFHKQKRKLEGDVPSPLRPPPGCHFHPRCRFANDRCRTEAPVLRDFSEHGVRHHVACHHVDQVREVMRHEIIP